LNCHRERQARKRAALSDLKEGMKTQVCSEQPKVLIFEEANVDAQALALRLTRD